MLLDQLLALEETRRRRDGKNGVNYANDRYVLRLFGQDARLVANCVRETRKDV